MPRVMRFTFRVRLYPTPEKRGTRLWIEFRGKTFVATLVFMPTGVNICRHFRKHRHAISKRQKALSN